MGGVPVKTLERATRTRCHGRQRAVPGGRVREGLLHAARAQPGLLGQRRAGVGHAGGRPAHLPGVPEPRHHDPGSAHGHARRRAGRPAAQFTALKGDAGLKTIAYNFINWDYIDFNCYDNPESGGNPVLRDPAFRVALDYAVDRERVVQVVYNGRAAPGYTMLTPTRGAIPTSTGSPRRRQAALRPGQGRAAARRAGYRDSDGDGVREESRESPSRCGCGPWPSHPRPRPRASSSPAGSSSWASTSASRSWTTGWPATRCMRGRATHRRPTTT